jgi:hypothetical protein
LQPSSQKSQTILNLRVTIKGLPIKKISQIARKAESHVGLRYTPFRFTQPTIGCFYFLVFPKQPAQLIEYRVGILAKRRDRRLQIPVCLKRKQSCTS